MKTARSYPVAPDSVYVWRGYMSPAKTYADFVEFLGQVFVPACALLQPSVGLRAYLPTMVPQSGKPAAVPDQTALMFWATPEAHDLAEKAIAVRIYQNLHGDAYDMTRSKLPEVPVALSAASGSLQAEQPYYLLDQPVDWMFGKVFHLVGSRRADLTPAAFLAAAFGWASSFRDAPPADVDAALICCGNDYAVAWVHGTRKLASALDGLAALTVPVLQAAPISKTLPAGLWGGWPGLDLTKHTCLNLQFPRPARTRTTPRKPGAK
ncbi:MAG TPA: hypothetical protein VK752_10755 [Bryobacteraceae bacterium]|jgi:hypothetical protein|nr:hypothetical protein [Bryobacteraceae bacterium]